MEMNGKYAPICILISECNLKHKLELPMIKKIKTNPTSILLTVIFLFLINACQRDPDVLEPATYPVIPEVFIDGFSSGLNYAAFGGSKVTAFDVDRIVKFSGTASMRIEVPDFEDPLGAYAGGAYFTNVGRDLSGFDVLTFWAKSSQPANIDVVGIGNDLAFSLNQVIINNLAVNTNWKKYYIPIPDPSRWKSERGMFFYSEGPENNKGYTIWFDEVKFEKVGTIAHPRPVILNRQNQNIVSFIGQKLNIGDTYILYNMPNGVDQRVNVAPSYFTYTSSDENVARVNQNGQISVVGMGTATVTAKFGSKNAEGSISISVMELPPKAPVPTVPASNVISLFSNAYNNVPIDSWATGWQYSTAKLQEIKIDGDDVKLYTDLNFNGIEFSSQRIDASLMTHFHMDIWTPEPTNAPRAFKVMLVDFGANGVYGGGDDVSHELSFTANTNPALRSKQWVQLDIPLSAFTGLTTRRNLAQLVISGDLRTVFVDNVYFYRSGGAIPTAPAPTPTFPASNVISLFSNAYVNVPVDTWSASWDQADVSDVKIAGNDVKLYTNLVFAGIEFISQKINASTMTHFYMDMWTPDPTALPAVFRIKLVDFGANGVYGGGDDVEHELTFNANSNPPLVTGNWIRFDIPLTSFTGLTTRSNLAQLIISGTPKTVYIDNVLFHK